MPVVAGVHWSGSGGKNSHWVLIVGADGDGVVFNDPWGGKQQIRLNQGALGKYSIDTAYTFFFSPGSGNFSMAAVDDNGDSLPEEALPHTLQNLTDEGIDRFGQDAGGQSDAASGGLDGGFVLGGQAGSGSAPLQSSGCTAGSGPGDRLGALLLLILPALALLRRRRAAD
jgi:MYXO-CTERM domain-containing protein